MRVKFRRTGERRYGVRVEGPEHPPMEVNPAPGYDDRLPHDLVHFAVEVELGIRDGVFGQIAAGGDSGTFRLDPAIDGSRGRTRQQRDVKKKGRRLSRSGHRDAVFSEHAANIGLHDG